MNEPASRSDIHRRRASRILTVVAILFVVIPFLFWRGTWFGRTLSDEELSQYLAETDKPRHRQHALVQIGERIARDRAGARRWYPQVVESAASPQAEIRVTAAWVMGGDSRSEEFHRTLLTLLHDPEPLVRRNAALSLVRFGDPSGKPELLKMLHAFSIRAPGEGTLHYRRKPDDKVDGGKVVAQIAAGQEVVQIHAPVPGKVQTLVAKDGAQVTAGQEILILSPGAEHVWEALRALYVVGEPSDLAEIEPYASGAVADMPARIQQQANLTAAEIRRRAGQTTQRQ